MRRVLSRKELKLRQSEMYELVGKLLSARPITEKCGRCGTRVRLLRGEFWLRTTVFKWEMLLPFCPMCDGSMEGSLDYSIVRQDKNHEGESDSTPRPPSSGLRKTEA